MENRAIAMTSIGLQSKICASHIFFHTDTRREQKKPKISAEFRCEIWMTFLNQWYYSALTFEDQLKLEKSRSCTCRSVPISQFLASGELLVAEDWIFYSDFRCLFINHQFTANAIRTQDQEYLSIAIEIISYLDLATDIRICPRTFLFFQ